MNAYISKIIGNALGMAGPSTIQPELTGIAFQEESNSFDPFAIRDDHLVGQEPVVESSPGNRDIEFPFAVRRNTPENAETDQQYPKAIQPEAKPKVISVKTGHELPADVRGTTNQTRDSKNEQLIMGQRPQEQVSTRKKSSGPENLSVKENPSPPSTFAGAEIGENAPDRSFNKPLMVMTAIKPPELPSANDQTNDRQMNVPGKRVGEPEHEIRNKPIVAVSPSNDGGRRESRDLLPSAPASYVRGVASKPNTIVKIGRLTVEVIQPVKEISPPPKVRDTSKFAPVPNARPSGGSSSGIKVKYGLGQL